MARDLTCDELVELVTDYLEGRLPAPERARFERHLDGCPGCRSYLAQIRIVARTASLVPGEPIPARARDELVAAFRGWRPGWSSRQG